MSRKQVGHLQSTKIPSTLRIATPRHQQHGDDQLNMFQTISHTLTQTSLAKLYKTKHKQNNDKVVKRM